MNRIVVFCLAGVIGVAFVPLGWAAEPACTYYKVNTSLLNISKEAGSGIYIDVLEDGEIACITRQQKSDGRDWGFIAHKLQKPDGTAPVNGWSTLAYLKKLSAAEAKAAGAGKTAPAATAASPPPAAKSPADALPSAAATPPAKIRPEDVLRFDQPVPFGPYPVNGNTLKKLAESTPLFPPIEGLDEALWKKQCTSCHKWNQQRLCAQGGTYVKVARYALRHQHPFGGAYKIALMKWSRSGCQ
ncbi:MAG: hypothetical protein OEM91_03780 [Hyphomicrobiales bacterium]|nr:hypothetical protein [Hyphomicrobiales bacterium]